MTRKDLDARISEILSRHGAFFAFSQRQFEEQQVKGVKYTNCGGGMACPEGAVDQLSVEIEAAIDAYRAADLAENGKAKIIWRELANHEAQLTHDITPTVEALQGYGITREEVKAEWAGYLRHCVENDLF